MDTHHPAIAAAEEADRAYMDRWDAEAVRPVLAAMAKLKRYQLSPWVIGALAAGLAELAGKCYDPEARDCAKRYLDDLMDDFKNDPYGGVTGDRRPAA